MGLLHPSWKTALSWLVLQGMPKRHSYSRMQDSADPGSAMAGGFLHRLEHVGYARAPVGVDHSSQLHADACTKATVHEQHSRQSFSLVLANSFLHVHSLC